MTSGEIVVTIITGLVINEFGEVSPWAARKLARWSARRRYANPARADTRAEELAALIDERPGKLFKLITALGFAAAAVVSRKSANLASAAPLTPLWQPVPLTPSAKFDSVFVNTLGSHASSAEVAPMSKEQRDARIQAVRQAWRLLTDDIHQAAMDMSLASRSWRRCLKRLRRITRDDRWTLITQNVSQLYKISKNCGSHPFVGHADAGSTTNIPTESTIISYRTSTESVRRDIHRLTGSRRGSVERHGRVVP